MTRLNYTTPVSTHSSKCLSFLNEFFYYGHHKYTVLTDAKPKLHIIKTKQQQSACEILLKVALLFTGVVPLVAAAYRLAQFVKWSSYKKVKIVYKNKINLMPSKQDILAVKEGKMTLQEYATKYKDWKTLLKNHGTEITELNLRDFFNLQMVLQNLQYCPNLEKLHLDGNKIRSNHIKKLVTLSFTNLQTLSLSRDISCGRGLKGKDIAILLKSPVVQNVTSLDLQGQKCSGVGIKAIAESYYLKKLSSLSLSACEILDGDVEALVHSDNATNITSLNLSDNDLTLYSAQCLVDAEKLKNLTQLYLSGNDLGFLGMKILAKAPHLEKLKVLDLRSNPYNNVSQKNIRALFKDSLKLELS